MKNNIIKSVCILFVCASIFTACKTATSKDEDSTTTTVDTTSTSDAVENVEEKEKSTDKNDTSKSTKKEDLKIVPLTVNVTNLKSKTATVVIGLYAPANKFLDENDQLKEYRIKPKNGKFSAKITNQNYGEFGMAIYQDVDGDGKITKNLIGIPKEPYAFSNNYKPTIKAPSFNDCKFTYSAKSNTVNMKLIQ